MCEKISFNVRNSACMFFLFFSIRVFFHGHWRFTGHQAKEGGHLLFHSSTSTRSQTFRHLFATLHVRWLSHIFNRTACIYQAATRWDLPPYWITIWLIDDVTIAFVCLHDHLILAFFVTAIWDRKRVNSRTSTVTLVLQANRLTKKLKIFRSYVKHFLILVGWEIAVP